MHAQALLLATAACGALAAPAKRAGEFLFTGTNEAGGEFGTAFPGQLDEDYTWPSPSAIDQLFDLGMNTFRVALKMERATPESLTNSINETYFEGFESVINHITSKGAYAVVDPHNYGRFYDEIITDVEAFGAWWTTVATRFADNANVIFDTNNEYHDMDMQLVVDLNQAAIDAIRATGATSQYIFVEGNAWTGAWSWVSSGNGEAMLALADPEDKLVFEMHQYLDEDSSGTHDACVSATIGAERVQEATQWLKDNGKKGIIGEMAGAVNEVCIEAVKGQLQHLLDNSDVWTGWLWWAAGPWWSDYMFSIEPTTGPAYVGLLEDIQPFIGA
ncbi:glycoside hydrolase superfamily [Stachybotrys elegans]|uniref:cellulase n=1 Tax=Stachybotrys elegans TaxID=80388 RepID=A0A8K0WT27_9HYPO|nr:glycoside hydrolase superfamily [Stachybotrys elegans]